MSISSTTVPSCRSRHRSWNHFSAHTHTHTHTHTHLVFLGKCDVPFFLLVSSEVLPELSRVATRTDFDLNTVQEWWWDERSEGEGEGDMGV